MNKYHMKVLQINTVYPNGSTGKIAKGIHDTCKTENISCITAYRYHEKGIGHIDDTEVVGTWLDCHIHNRLVKYTLLQGFFSCIQTKIFLKKITKYTPDIVHLHNLHGSYINLPLLFGFIKKNKIPVVWTLHDCWSFTGYCPHFVAAKCDKWKDGCAACEHYSALVSFSSDIISWMWKQKKGMFTGIPNLTLVTPSGWLAGLVKESFLKDYPVKVINNGIDLSIFKPRENSFREKHGITQDKHIVLGVAFGWGYRKGLDVFLKLSETLGKDYQVVLVGTDDTIDQKLPENIISIHRTHNQTELAEIYSAADVFANPTREETFPTVNMEALACGTPVITFETGGSPEILDETCGIVVPCDDVDAMERAIRHVCEDKPFSQEACLKRAGCFSMQEKFREYVELYEQIAK